MRVRSRQDLDVAGARRPAPLAAQTVNPYCQDPAYRRRRPRRGERLPAGDRHLCRTPRSSTRRCSRAATWRSGSADALGGFPKFRVGAARHRHEPRRARLPRERDPRRSGASRTTITTQGTDFATVAADGALGLFGGIRSRHREVRRARRVREPQHRARRDRGRLHGHARRASSISATAPASASCRRRRCSPASASRTSCANMPSSTVIATDVFQQHDLRHGPDDRTPRRGAPPSASTSAS